MRDSSPIRLQVVMKLDGFCNARCRYCYEFGRLHLRTPMPIRIVRRAAEQFGRFASDLAISLEHPVELGFVLHGGEPLVQPIAYLEEVLGLLEASPVTPAILSLGVQTNALGTREAALRLLLQHKVRVSVSDDVIPGVRVTVGGKPMEAMIAPNIARFADLGLLSGGITVISRVTAQALREVHLRWEERGVPYRLLPLFKNGGPQVEDYSIGEDETCEALADLTGWLLDTGRPVLMEPIRPALEVALADLGSVRVPRAGPIPFGRSAFVIDTDGSLYEAGATDYTPDARLGNIAEEEVRVILSGERIHRLLAADAAEKHAVCTTCEFTRACTGAQLQQDNRRMSRCGFHHALVARLRPVLLERGIGLKEARSLLVPAHAA